jgi:hypothetical protein
MATHPLVGLDLRQPEDAALMTKYLIGLDLGKKQDPAAIAVVRWQRPRPVHPQTSLSYPGSRPEAIYTVMHIERVPLGTTYESIVKVVCALRHNPIFRAVPPTTPPTLVEDAGGVGAVVSEMFRRAGVFPRDIITVPGLGYTQALDGTHHVAKKRLVDALRVVSEARPVRLELGPRLADGPALRRELQTFDENFRETGHLVYSARVQEHDDMILAIAYAVWWGEQWLGKAMVIY